MVASLGDRVPVEWCPAKALARGPWNVSGYVFYCLAKLPIPQSHPGVLRLVFGEV